MPFTAEEIANVSNAVIEYHLRGQPLSQVLQDRPLYNDMMANKKTFPGGKEIVDGPVKGQYTTRFEGYTHDDEVSYRNPANIRRWQARWYELHAGISFTNTELKIAGIKVTDTMVGDRTSNVSDQEKFALVNLLEDKIEDMMEGSRRSMAEILWRDGTQDAKVFPGITSIITATPAVGVKLGIDCAANAWWRNRAVTNINAATPANQVLVQTLQKEVRQLRRFAKSPKHKAYAGSDWMDAFEMELRSKGSYTLDGWAKSGRIDASVADLAFKGVEIVYDPLLDDLGSAKACYWVDLNAIKLMPMDGEEEKQHAPARPPERYAFYRAQTWTGMMAAMQLNSSGLYTIA